MSLLSSVPFAQQTVYRAEFPPKSVTRARSRAVMESQIVFNMNPFEGSEEECCKRIELFRQKVQQEQQQGRPSISRYMQQPIDLHLVRACHLPTTTYQAHYTSRTAPKQERRGYKLPQNWIIEPTSQKASYREPGAWGTNFIPSKQIRHTGNLTPNEKEREILLVSTGESVYRAGISKTGEYILEKPQPVEKPTAHRDKQNYL